MSDMTNVLILASAETQPETEKKSFEEGFKNGLDFDRCTNLANRGNYSLIFQNQYRNIMMRNLFSSGLATPWNLETVDKAISSYTEGVRASFRSLSKVYDYASKEIPLTKSLSGEKVFNHYYKLLVKCNQGLRHPLPDGLIVKIAKDFAIKSLTDRLQPMINAIPTDLLAQFSGIAPFLLAKSMQASLDNSIKDVIKAAGNVLGTNLNYTPSQIDKTTCNKSFRLN
jgi:hypothetical protein